MKANELMIGDWLKCSDPTPFRITDIETEKGTSYFSVIGDDGWVVDGGELEPIPLTAEILNKNFPKPNEDYWVEGDFPIIGYSIPCITDGNRPYVEVSIYDPARVMEFEMFFHYVHELQHALRLCGIEKEIEL